MGIIRGNLFFNLKTMAINSRMQRGSLPVDKMISYNIGDPRKVNFGGEDDGCTDNDSYMDGVYELLTGDSCGNIGDEARKLEKARAGAHETVEDCLVDVLDERKKF